MKITGEEKWSVAVRQRMNLSFQVSRGPKPEWVYQPPKKMLTTLSSGLNP